MQPKFKVGDRVVHRRTGRVLTVLDVRHQIPVVTPAIVVLEDGSSKIEMKAINEYYSYKLNDGHCWRYQECLLELF